MHFLGGDVAWGVGEADTVPGKYDTLVIPAGKELVLKVREPTLYVCDYVKE